MKPQLAVRDLFWLVLVVGLVIGWWVDRSRLSKELGRFYRTGLMFDDDAPGGHYRIWRREDDDPIGRSPAN